MAARWCLNSTCFGGFASGKLLEEASQKRNIDHQQVDLIPIGPDAIYPLFSEQSFELEHISL